MIEVIRIMSQSSEACHALQDREESGRSEPLVAVIQTAPSGGSADLRLVRRSQDSVRRSQDLIRSHSNKSRTRSGRMGRSKSGASGSSPSKAAAKADFGKIVEKEERSTGGVELKMYRVLIFPIYQFKNIGTRISKWQTMYLQVHQFHIQTSGHP